MSIEIFVENISWAHRTTITIVERRDGKIFVAKPINLEFVELQEGARNENEYMGTIALNDDKARQLFLGLSEALEKQGIKPKHQAFLEGELDATKHHLDDLRHLLKLDERIETMKKQEV